MADSTSKCRTNVLKYVNLIALTLQYSAQALSLRYGRTRADKEELFFNSTGWLVGIHLPSMFIVRSLN